MALAIFTHRAGAPKPGGACFCINCKCFLLHPEGKLIKQGDLIRVEAPDKPDLPRNVCRSFGGPVSLDKAGD